MLPFDSLLKITVVDDSLIFGVYSLIFAANYDQNKKILE